MFAARFWLLRTHWLMTGPGVIGGCRTLMLILYWSPLVTLTLNLESSMVPVVYQELSFSSNETEPMTLPAGSLNVRVKSDVSKKQLPLAFASMYCGFPLGSDAPGWMVALNSDRFDPWLPSYMHLTPLTATETASDRLFTICMSAPFPMASLLRQVGCGCS